MAEIAGVFSAKTETVARPWQRKFLGYSVTWHRKPKLKIAQPSRQRFAEKIRQTLRGAHGRSLRQVIAQLNPVLRGRVAYFRLTEERGVLEAFDGWLRRNLRVLLWRPWKRLFYTSEASDARGDQSSALMAVGHQRVRSLVERRQFAHERSLPHVLVRAHGVDLAAGHSAALLVGFRCGTARRVVWEDGGGNLAS
jgi:hypothetical protein